MEQPIWYPSATEASTRRQASSCSGRPESGVGVQVLPQSVQEGQQFPCVSHADLGNLPVRAAQCIADQLPVRNAAQTVARHVDRISKKSAAARIGA